MSKTATVLPYQTQDSKGHLQGHAHSLPDLSPYFADAALAAPFAYEVSDNWPSSNASNNHSEIAAADQYEALARLNSSCALDGAKIEPLDFSEDFLQHQRLLPPIDNICAPKPDCIVCPFCRLHHHNRSDAKRKSNQLLRWYSKYGYEGPAYCKRCSETMNNHVLRRTAKRHGNRAGCTRDEPCAHCSNILQYFGDVDALFALRDAEQRRRLRRRAPKRHCDAGISESAGSKFKSMKTPEGDRHSGAMSVVSAK